MKKMFYLKCTKIDISQYIGNRMIYIQNKTRNKEIRKEEKHIADKATLQLVSVEVIRKLPRSQGCDYRLSLLAIATKFVMLYKLRKATRPEVIREIKEFVSSTITRERYLLIMENNIFILNGGLIITSLYQKTISTRETIQQQDTTVKQGES